MSNLPTPSDDEDPLTLTSYLLSPVEAIVHSTQAVAPDSLSLHDILEAYHILSTRIRRLSSDLEAVPIPITALAPLQTNCASIVVALRRDVSRALRVHVQRDSYECGARFSVAAEGSICVGAACNPKCASESSLLCLYALRLLSEVFRLPPLSSLFSGGSSFSISSHALTILPEGDLGLLLDDVLMITRSQLPSFNAPKISAVAGWILRTQQLPQSVLVLRIKDICSYLETILDDNRQETHDHVAIVDALECIVSLMTRHGPISVADTTELLPFVLPLIMHSSPELRHHVAIVLAAFSRTITMHRTVVSQKTIDTIAFHTNAFLVPETTRRPASSRKLALLLDEAVISKHLDDVGCNTPWALTVTASFTIMLGASLFASPGPLKLLLTTTHKAKGRPLGQALHPHVWRTFIWSMSQLRAQQKPFTEASVDIFQRSVRVLKQALGNGLGGALVSSLLGASPSLAGGSRRWIIPSTIDVVRDMLSSQSAIVREDGLRLLVCITCKVATSVGDVPSASWSEDSLLSQFLLDGSLLRADKSRVEELAGLASFFPPRCLSEEEVLLHWEVVFECLVLVVQNHFNYGGVDLACAALSVWQSLLLVKAHLDQDLNNLAEFSLQLPNLLSGFLPGPTIMLSGEADSLELQIRALSVLTQLWAAVQSIFSQAWLVAVASSLLASVSRRAFHLSNEDVLKNWSSLCSALIAAGVNVLELISAQDDSQDTLEFKRQLWRLTATSWKESQFSNLQNTVSFLVLPMSSWEMSTEELDVWEQVFERGASSAAVISVKMVDVIEGISSQLLIVLSSLSISTALRLAVAMLRHLELDVFEALGVLHNVMISLPALLFEPAVLHLQAGLAVWIEDKHALVSDSEYNADLAPLYISILKRLQDVSPSVASLNAVAPLLTSAFSHIPHPAKGPFAFQEFFSAAYKRLALPANAYRDDLRTCVQACVRIHDGKLPVGMEPLSSSSQTQTQFHNGGAHLSIQAVTPPVSGNNARTQDLDTPSMEVIKCLSLGRNHAS
ncbi:hypothetical protein BC834DRAFT_578053 [Gloeopeniophorella convolvens]|nr:hypothetical protein BC834DRAFT_578053 [Gloeopeniophorella convolvens]